MVITEYDRYVELVPSGAERFFVQFRGGKFTKQPVGKSGIAAVAEFLGVPDVDSFTGHSLRVSAATVLADSGASECNLKRFGRWKSTSAMDRYFRESKRLKIDMGAMLSSEKSNLPSSKGSHIAPESNSYGGWMFDNCVVNVYGSAGGAIVKTEAKKMSVEAVEENEVADGETGEEQGNRKKRRRKK